MAARIPALTRRASVALAVVGGGGLGAGALAVGWPLPFPWLSLVCVGLGLALGFPVRDSWLGPELPGADWLPVAPGPGVTSALGRGTRIAGDGAGALIAWCASRCSGAGSAPASAVPQSATSATSTNATASTGSRRGPRRRAGSGSGRAARNAVTAAVSPASSRSVAGPAAAARTSSRVRWLAGSWRPRCRLASKSSAVASSGDSRLRLRAEDHISAREAANTLIALRLPGLAR